MRLLSPAKINLGLWVLGRRPDRYHEIFTLFQTVDLFDEVYIKEGPLRVETNTGIPMEENLVYKALLEFWRRTGVCPEVTVYINKRIPQGAGLGGGSSNVAVVLRVVNEILGGPLTEEELLDIASSISSDAPFFLRGGTAIGRGRGEILEPIEPLDLTFTLIVPDVSSSTGKVYSLLQERHFREPPDIEDLIANLRDGSADLLENVLGDIASEVYPQIGEVKRFLESLGLRPLVTGTGSGVFYIGSVTPEVKRGSQLRGWKVFEIRSWPGA
ncbi:MAG: 4-(cytidine 5'-diphospho)-2-C-methyl-D-erythritol kinase [Aquificota bacterium]|nr:4-(cytidine 5'-diphospho)-2-C-methyl-D-erythritol kinase [Aquificota bacterium]